MTIRPPRRAALAALAALTIAAGCAERREPAPIVFQGSQPSQTPSAVAAPPSPVAVQALPAPAGPAPAASGVVDYGGYSAIVAGSGDTLEAMAARVGLAPSALAAYNGLPAGWRPDPGDELILPPREGGYASAAAPAPVPAAPVPAAAVPAPVPASAPAPARQLEPVRTASASGDLDLDRIAATLETPASPPPGAPPAPAPEPAARTAAVAPAAASPAAASGRFLRPVEGEVLRAFNRSAGPQRNNGIDFAASAGSPVVAAADGRVALITQPVGVDGAIVMIDHGDDLLAIYGRLEDIAVQKDQTVRRGELLGRVAPAEAADRPYLQFEMIKGTESVDPADYLG